MAKFQLSVLIGFLILNAGRTLSDSKPSASAERFLKVMPTTQNNCQQQTLRFAFASIGSVPTAVRRKTQLGSGLREQKRRSQLDWALGADLCVSGATKTSGFQASASRTERLFYSPQQGQISGTRTVSVAEYFVLS